MVWLFASVVLVLMVLVKAFRKFMFTFGAIVGGLWLLMSGAAYVVQEQERSADDARIHAQSVLPICGGKDSAQTFLDKGGVGCRPQ